MLCDSALIPGLRPKGGQKSHEQTTEQQVKSQQRGSVLTLPDCPRMAYIHTTLFWLKGLLPLPTELPLPSQLGRCDEVNKVGPNCPLDPSTCEDHERERLLTPSSINLCSFPAPLRLSSAYLNQTWLKCGSLDCTQCNPMPGVGLLHAFLSGTQNASLPE